MAQCATAGFIGGLCSQHWSAWHADRANTGAFWLMVWSVVLALLFLTNGVLPILPQGSITEAGLFLRSQLVATSVLLAVPTIRSFTRGRPIRWYVVVAGAMMIGRSVLWLTTDLVYAHAVVAGVPQYGPLFEVTFFAPVAVVTSYVAASMYRMPTSRIRHPLRVAGALSLVGLLIAYLMPGGRVAELLVSLWALPLVAVLQAMGVLRARAAEERARRLRGMRGALAAIGNAAWFTKNREALLTLAETAAREQLADATLTGSMRELSHGRFSTEFHSDVGPARDALSRDFLDDLRRIVSVAAERTRLAEDLREAAFTDSLTALPNRHALERHLEQVLARAVENGTPVAVLYCDIDGFKQENDQHGHAWGDDLLRRTARDLRDSVGTDDFVARFGGDEFVLVLADFGSRGELVELARRIRTGSDLEYSSHIQPLLSVGVALWTPGDTAGPEQLLREADTAMFAGKRSGIGVVVFDEELRERMVSDLTLRHELETALVNDEFELHYQPIVDATTLGIVGVEALVRWQHPDGLRMPARWVAFAEETGQIVPIGRRLVVAARAGARRFGLPVAVNFAARQLTEPQFLEHLRLDWGEDDWHLLTLEITESALLENLAHVIDSLTAVRALGARIAIDDFGTGYSSFARLANLPVDVLKIDQAFVRNLDGPGGAAIVRAIVSLAQAYRLDIIAEGVERIDQLERLVVLGVPKLQGYLLGRPSASAPAPVDLSAAGPSRQARAVIASRAARAPGKTIADELAGPVPPVRRAASV